jgi:Arc/MetJ-type ribon-helix-helix transcriptional regulator
MTDEKQDEAILDQLRKSEAHYRDAMRWYTEQIELNLAGQREAEQRLAAARAAAAEREDYGSKVAKQMVRTGTDNDILLYAPGSSLGLYVSYNGNLEVIREAIALALNAALAEGERRGALSMRNRAVQFVHDCGHKSTAYDLGHLPLSQD